MSRPRVSMNEITLRAGAAGIKAALNRRAEKPGRSLAHRDDLERMYQEVLGRRDAAHQRIVEEGDLITVTKTTAKGDIYQTRVLNPLFRVVNACERTLSQLARLLSSFDDGPKIKEEPAPGSAAAMFPELIDAN